MKILIVGLGVIGGGYAMALKEAGYEEVYGVDINTDTLKRAKEMGVIKEGFIDEDEIISKVDLIVLAIYPDLVKNFIIKNKDKIKDNAIITDVTGIKQLFINDIVEILPDNIDFVFAHPMAGREKKGIDYATNEVFKGANFLIIETEKNKEENLKLINSNFDCKFGYITVDKFDKKVIGEISKIAEKIEGIAVCVSKDGKIVVAVSDKCSANHFANDILKNILDNIGGKGGGNKKVAAGGADKNFGAIIEYIEKIH